MKHVLTTYTISEGIYCNGYYSLNDEDFDTLYQWYNSFIETNEDYWISDNITINPSNFDLGEVEEDAGCMFFIEKYGNPCNILEHVDELKSIFDSTYNKLRCESTDTEDSDLYTGTETVQRLIQAHVNGNHDEVQLLLNDENLDRTDDIVVKISLVNNK